MSYSHARASLILISVLLFAKYASAQDKYPIEHREWEVTGFTGTSAGNSFEFPTTVLGNSGQSSRTVGMHYSSGYLVGVRINQNLGDFWAADLEYSFSNQFLRFTNLSPSIQSLSLDHFLHNFTYNVSYLALPRTSRFRPFADAGVGAALFYLPGRVKKDARELDLFLRDSWEFVFNWGGGFKYLVMDEFAVTVDVKDRISGVPSYGLPSTARIINGHFQPGFAPHGTMQNWQFNFGLTYQWDEY
jgi:opacity protein-like surface antigen